MCPLITSKSSFSHLYLRETIRSGKLFEVILLASLGFCTADRSSTRDLPELSVRSDSFRKPKPKSWLCQEFPRARRRRVTLSATDAACTKDVLISRCTRERTRLMSFKFAMARASGVPRAFTEFTNFTKFNDRFVGYRTRVTCRLLLYYRKKKVEFHDTTNLLHFPCCNLYIFITLKNICLIFIKTGITSKGKIMKRIK